MRCRMSVALAVLVIYLYVFAGTTARPAEADTKPEKSAAELVRSLATSVKQMWIGVPAGPDGKSMHRQPVSRDCWEIFEAVAAIPAEQAVQLALGGELDELEGHLLQIAMALKERRETWEALDVYYELAVHLPTRAPVSPQPKAEHLGAEYLCAWEWMLVCPKAYGWRMSATAARALAKIGDPRSLPLMEIAFRWMFDRGGRAASGSRIRDALGMYTGEARAEALKTAFRCWTYARDMAGKEVPRESASRYRRKVEQDKPERVLRGIARRFPAQTVQAELEKAEPDSDYAAFLEHLLKEAD